MKKIVTFEQATEAAGSKGIDAAILAGFGKCEYVKDGLVGMPFGTVEVDGVAYDWIMKNDYYLFIIAE